MSLAALAWAARQKLPCTQKIVLLMLANRHNSDSGRCDPSHDRLAEDCGLTRRSVMDQIVKLSENGFIRIRHRALGGKHLANQYTLVLSFGVQEEVKDLVDFTGDDNLKGSEPRSPLVKKVVNHVHQVVNDVHQGSEPRSPKTVIEPVREPKEKARERATAPSVLKKPEDVDQQIWDDWLQLRKGKRAAATQTVLTEARVQAEKAGLTLERFLAVWCARGSQALEADWLKPTERGTTDAATPSSDPDTQSAVEAEARSKGIAPWDGIEQFPTYKARVRGTPTPKTFDLNTLAGMAANRNGAH